MFSNKWHKRYFVIDPQTRELTYSKTDQDKKARGHFNLKGATVSKLDLMKGQNYAFKIVSQSKSKKLYLAGDSPQESKKWKDLIERIADSTR